MRLARCGRRSSGRKGGFASTGTLLSPAASDRPLYRRRTGVRIRSLTTESNFRAIALLNIVVCLPIGLYFRIRSQATREKLDRKEEGVFILLGLRLCLLL